MKFFFFLGAVLIFSCNQPIEGSINYNIKERDTVYFSSGDIDGHYYQYPTVSSVVYDNKFILDNAFSYPQLYFLSYASEKDSIVMRSGLYFFDSTMSFIELEDYGECSKINSETYLEFKERFAPFILNGKAYDCKTNNIQAYAFTNEEKFEAKLLDYVKENPDSFVGLWILIQQFNTNGHKIGYEEIMDAFSVEMKKHHLYKRLSKAVKAIRISENKEFPALNLSNINLETEKLRLKKINTEYILVYYWFSSCRPCLRSFPELNAIYSQFKDLGFEIVGISTDNTQNINKWKQVIKAYDLSWIHYLDENGNEAKKDKIVSFPTSFLLDKSRNIVLKNPSSLELKEFLNSKL